MNVRGLSIAHVKSHLQVKQIRNRPASHDYLVAVLTGSWFLHITSVGAFGFSDVQKQEAGPRVCWTRESSHLLRFSSQLSLSLSPNFNLISSTEAYCTHTENAMDWIMHFLNLRCTILAVFSPMDFHMMRRGDHRFHDMFLHRAPGSVISSGRLLHNGEFFGSRNAVSPEAASRLHALLQRRQQPSMQTFDFKNYSSSLRYLINHQIEMKSAMRTPLLSSCDRAKP